MDDLGRIRQITGEFHAFEFFAYPQWRERVIRVLDKLSSQFALIHVHANNCAGITLFDGTRVPNVLELTLVNRRCYNLADTDENFPGPLDRPCSPDNPEIMLGQFRY